jgi:hypothetical protein
MGWKVRRAATGYDPRPQIRYGVRPTADDGQIDTLRLPMSILVVDLPDRAPHETPSFITLNLSQEAGFGFIVARPDQEDTTVYVVRSIDPVARGLPLAWLPLEDFRDLWRWAREMKVGVGVEPLPQWLPPIRGFYRNLSLPGPRWVFGSWENTMVGSSSRG